MAAHLCQEARFLTTPINSGDDNGNYDDDDDAVDDDNDDDDNDCDSNEEVDKDDGFIKRKSTSDSTVH